MEPIYCTICGKNHTNDNYHKLCSDCYEHLHRERMHMYTEGNTKGKTFLDISEQALKEVKNKFRRGKLKPMKQCECCHAYVHTLVNTQTTKMLGIDVCVDCYTKAQRAWLDNPEITMESSLYAIKSQNGKRQVVPVTYEDETFEVVKVHKQPLSSKEYRDIEYNFLNTFAPHFGSVNQELQHLHELMDIALLAGDIEWARDLHKQIQNLKGANK